MRSYNAAGGSRSSRLPPGEGELPPASPPPHIPPPPHLGRFFSPPSRSSSDSPALEVAPGSPGR